MDFVGSEFDDVSAGKFVGIVFDSLVDFAGLYAVQGGYVAVQDDVQAVDAADERSDFAQGKGGVHRRCFQSGKDKRLAADNV